MRQKFKNYPNEFNSKIKKFDNQIRKINLISVPYDDLKPTNINLENISKDDQELLDFYKKNIQKYFSIEKRDISYLAINKEDEL